MGKLIFFIFAIGFSISSCGTGEPGLNLIKTEYSISNISNHSIKLKVFDAYFNNIYKDTVFLIPINEEINYEYLNWLHYPFSGNSDSAYIVFDNIKQIIYRRDDGKPRNILNESNYEGGKVDDYLYKYEYFITDEDYENAIEIK